MIQQTLIPSQYHSEHQQEAEKENTEENKARKVQLVLIFQPQLSPSRSKKARWGKKMKRECKKESTSSSTLLSYRWWTLALAGDEESEGNMRKQKTLFLQLFSLFFYFFNILSLISLPSFSCLRRYFDVMSCKSGGSERRRRQSRWKEWNEAECIAFKFFILFLLYSTTLLVFLAVEQERCRDDDNDNRVIQQRGVGSSETSELPV